MTMANPLKTTLLVLLAAVLTLGSIKVIAQDDDQPAADVNSAEHARFLFAYKLLSRGLRNEAAAEFDRYLKQFPRGAKRGDAIYYRALLHRQQGESDKAVALLIDTPEPTLVAPVRLSLLQAQALLDVKQPEEALAVLQTVDEKKLDPALLVAVQYLRGRAAWANGNLAAAQESLERAAKTGKDPQLQRRILLDLARVQAARGQGDAAAKTLGPLIDDRAAKEAPEAAKLAGDLAYQANDYAEAAKRYELLLERFPASNEANAARIGLLWSKFSAADFKGVLRLHGQHREKLTGGDAATADYLAGVSAANLDDHQQAAKLLTNAAEGDGDDRLTAKALYQLAQSRQKLDDVEGMRRAIDELSRRFPQSPLRVDAAFLVASADAAEGDIEAGAAKLTDFIKAGPEHPYYRSALLRRARLYESAEQPAEAAADYLAYLDAPTDTPDPETATAVELRILALQVAMGQADQAATRATSLLGSGRLSAAQEQEVMFRLAQAQQVQKRYAEALKTLDTLEKQHPVHTYQAQAAYLRGLLLMSRDAAAKAVPLLLRASRDESLSEQQRVNALRVLAAAYRDAERPDQVRQLLLQIVGLAGLESLDVSERLWLARHMLDQNEPKLALRYLRDLDAGPALQDRAALLEGIAFRQDDKLEEARNVLLGVVARSARLGGDARLELARTMVAAKSYREALAELRGLTDDPKNPRLAAEALIEAGQIHQVLAEQARRAENPKAVADSLDEARRAYRFVTLVYDAENLEPLPQRGSLGLVDVAEQAGDVAAVKEALTSLIDKHREGPWVDYAKALLARQAGKDREARDAINRLKQQDNLPPKLRERLAKEK